MALFDFGKKKKAEEQKASSDCCCGGNCNKESITQSETEKTTGASIEVLGSGCAKCNQLEAAVKEALTELGMDTNIDHVTDFTKIAAYGVMTTPALVIDGKVVSFGKVLKKNEVIDILKKNRG